MKRIIHYILLMCMFGVVNAHAQNNSGVYGKNAVKLNLFALPVKNFSFQYERELTEKMSVSMGLRLMPNGSLPMKGIFETVFSEDGEEGMEGEADFMTDFLNKSKVSNWAITPEFRYYFGKKPLNGFYLAPFARFGGFSLSWPTQFEDDYGDGHEIKLKAKGTAFSAGLMLGAQWHVGDRWVIDWWIVGPAFGSMRLKLDAAFDPNQTPEEVIEEIEDYLYVDIAGAEVVPERSGNSITASTTMPFGGLRTGLCIGFTF